MEQPNYPFLKITRERFPRLLATRRPDKNLQNDKIFGAFLPVVAVRYLFDLIQRIFRLRTCELDIDGSFDAPCPEYFLHRCLAPCVREICDEKKYAEAVEEVELFLEGRKENLFHVLDREIEVLSRNLEFEKARQVLRKRKIIDRVLTDSKWKIHLFDATDVLTAKRAADEINLYLTTLRRGKIIGQKFFVFPADAKTEPDIFASFIENFYEFYAPKQIYVSHDFERRKMVEKTLVKRFGRKIKILAALPENLPPAVFTARKIAEIFRGNKNLRRDFDAEEISAILQNEFSLKNLPHRIECFDVAHLAGEAIVGARVLAVDGEILKDREIVWQFENLSETASLAQSVSERLKILPSRNHLPAFILLDGGKPQLSAVRKVLAETKFPRIKIIGAVKPPKHHTEIDYFLPENGEKVLFDKTNPAHQFLKQMRDAAHTLANSTHRTIHSLATIFAENSNAPKIQLLHVPLRFTERGGFADDLQPLRSLNQAGELIYESKKPVEIDGEKYKRRSRFSRKPD